MKRSALILFTVMTLVSSCYEKELTGPRSDGMLYAQLEGLGDTRTSMDDSNNILWSEGDQIVAFMKTSLGARYQVTEESIGESSASFVEVSTGSGGVQTGNELEQNVLYYPYSSSVKCVKSGNDYALSVVLPSEQTYQQESFGNGFFPMAAVSRTENLTFCNVCGGIKLLLTGTQVVTSIRIEGNDAEKLSGSAVVTVYPDGAKPSVAMSDDASASVTLDCGSGIRLQKNLATEFIVTVPPVEFKKGFTVTITDINGNPYVFETSKANTVYRSALLVMPAVTLEEYVASVTLSSSSLELYEGDSVQLTADIEPEEAADRVVTWTSENPGVATVGRNGMVTAIAEGETVIVASVGRVTAECTVYVSALAVSDASYIDEYGTDHGKGISVGMAVWAPVNCGYHKVDYPYGRLYQWGRKYGQGAEDDASVPTLVKGRGEGNDEVKGNVFFYGYDDWDYGSTTTLWNSGSESKPVKTRYDPCPNGWRVPTYAELEELGRNHSERMLVNKHRGYWFSGKVDFEQSSARVFLSSPGRRDYDDGHAYGRKYYGYYWSSKAVMDDAYLLGFDSGDPEISLDPRANGFSVRCVYDFNQIPLTSIDITDPSLKLYKGDTYQLHTYGKPNNANYNTARKWISDNPQVAVVDENGLVTAVSDGEAVITVSAGDVSDQCKVVVTTYAHAVATADYIDEYGINHGKGVSLGLAVWAPVNCGFKAPSDTDKGYPYGKLYQCGRLYGQGYSGEYDETVPSVQKIDMSMSEAQAEDYANVVFTGWESYSMTLWNTGSEEAPVKTENDPCPKGWRVPTFTELSDLSRNSSYWTKDSAGLQGCWFSGIYPYAPDAPQLFFPAAGRRNHNAENVNDREVKGYYWSSGTMYGEYYYGLTISENSRDPEIQYHISFGFSVRCVQE